jgi:hypothetical protein
VFQFYVGAEPRCWKSLNPVLEAGGKEMYLCTLLGVCLLEALASVPFGIVLVRVRVRVFEELHKFVVWEASARAPNSFAERAKLLWRLGLSAEKTAAAAAAAAAFRNGQWWVRSFDGAVRCSRCAHGLPVDCICFVLVGALLLRWRELELPVSRSVGEYDRWLNSCFAHLCALPYRFC